MPWAVLIAPAALLVAAIGLGWPWGAVTVAGCLLLPLAAMRVLMRFTMIYRGGEFVRQPLRAKVIRLAPGHIETVHQALPGDAGEFITEE